MPHVGHTAKQRQKAGLRSDYQDVLKSLGQVESCSEYPRCLMVHIVTDVREASEGPCVLL